ncbi:MAG: penicillin-binding transpeptidase domain-containing protein [Firmicutes bacterium]|nr:penicillin-binding transpeptidase domain-containing protein [Bacillota bacterium]
MKLTKIKFNINKSIYRGGEIIFLVFLIFLLISGVSFSTGKSWQDTASKTLGKNKGSIIILDMHSGKILAVVNPRIAFTESFPPGSLFKIITGCALLESQGFNPSGKITCRNYFALGTRKFTCNTPGGHGNVDFIKALAVSCSVYFYSKGQRLDGREILSIASSFGLGKKSGIDYRGESPGVLKKPGNKEQFTLMLAGEGGTCMITPLHAALMVSIIAGRGKFSFRAGKKIHEYKIKVRKKTIALLLEGMRQSVKKGTSKGASVEGLEIAGKTGTSEDERFPGETHAWFAGFAPFDKPEIAVVIFLEDGGHGFEAAGFAKKIFKFYRDKNK